MNLQLRSARSEPFRAVALLLLLILIPPLTGCHKWSRIEHPPVAAADTTKIYEHVRLHRSDGSAVVLYDVRLRSDSVVGYTVPRARSGARRTAVSRDEIEGIDRRTGDAVGTTLIIVGATAAAGVIALFIHGMNEFRDAWR